MRSIQRKIMSTMDPMEQESFDEKPTSTKRNISWSDETDQNGSSFQTKNGNLQSIDDQMSSKSTIKTVDFNTSDASSDDDNLAYDHYEINKPASFVRHTDTDISNSHNEFIEDTWWTKIAAIFAQDFYFALKSLITVVAWSALCVYLADLAKEKALENPDGAADRWLDYIGNSSSALSVLGTLFTFSLVFRFNVCYERWWEGRIFWGQIISATLDLAMMNRAWVRDQEYGDRISRFIIAYAYAVKAQLRCKSLTDDIEEGPALVERGILTPDEIRDLDKYPCWQPQYFTDMIREIILELHNDQNCLALSNDHKAYGQLFRCFDNVLVKLNLLSGETVRVRVAGMPTSYEMVHMFIFFVYFFLADIVWSVSMGWALPVFIGFSAAIVLFLITMASGLVDPFGNDIVDLPLRRFCETIEGQIYEIDARSHRGDLRRFAQSSKAKIPRRRSMDRRKRVRASYKIEELH